MKGEIFQTSDKREQWSVSNHRHSSKSNPESLVRIIKVGECNLKIIVLHLNSDPKSNWLSNHLASSTWCHLVAPSSASLWATAPWGKHACSSLTQQIPSPGNTCQLSSTTIRHPWLVCTVHTELGVLSVSRFCYVFPCELRGPAWAVGSYSISQSAGGNSQNIIFKTLRQIGCPAL